MARTDPQLNFRCPDELRERLEIQAAQNKRSLTGEIVSRLQQTFEAHPDEGALRAQINANERLNQALMQVNALYGVAIETLTTLIPEGALKPGSEGALAMQMVKIYIANAAMRGATPEKIAQIIAGMSADPVLTGRALQTERPGRSASTRKPKP